MFQTLCSTFRFASSSDFLSWRTRLPTIFKLTKFVAANALSLLPTYNLQCNGEPTHTVTLELSRHIFSSQPRAKKIVLALKKNNVCICSKGYVSFYNVVADMLMTWLSLVAVLV